MTKNRKTAAPASRAMADPAGEFASGSTRAILRGLDQMNRIHQQAFAASLGRHSATAKAAITDPGQFPQLHSQLVHEEMQAAAKYCGDLAEAAMCAQTELAACCAGMAGSRALFESAHLLD